MSYYNTPGVVNAKVTTAGTRVQLSATELPFKLAIIQANPGNGGKIYLGTSSVATTAYGVALSPSGVSSIGIGSSDNDARFDLSTLYIDTDNSGDGVSILRF